jgi:hypothetical protein
LVRDARTASRTARLDAQVIMDLEETVGNLQQASVRHLAHRVTVSALASLSSLPSVAKASSSANMS